jgi:hypothetical protein
MCVSICVYLFTPQMRTIHIYLLDGAQNMLFLHISLDGACSAAHIHTYLAVIWQAGIQTGAAQPHRHRRIQTYRQTTDRARWRP